MRRSWAPMPAEKKTGKRVQVYIPADLVDEWEQIPRYERSAEAAAALRAWWGAKVALKDISARTGETFGAIIGRLVNAEHERIEREEPGEEV